MSIARADGARLDLIDWIIHGPSGSMADARTTLPWPTLCEQIALVKVERRTVLVV